MFDVDHDKERAQAAGLEPNGFSFEGADPSGVDYALNRSVNKPSDEWVFFSSSSKVSAFHKFSSYVYPSFPRESDKGYYFTC